MKISEYMACLQAIFNEHGDLEVETLSRLTDSRVPHIGPTVTHVRILQSNEKRPRFVLNSDPVWRRGKKVCRI